MADIYGQLIKAQLEQLASDPTTVESLIYYNTADDVIKYRDGSAWRVVATTATALSNPMTTTGDIIYSSDGSGTPARLAIGVNGKRLRSGATIPAWGWQTTNAVASANYTITDTDGYDIIDVTTASSNRTITLPAAANNSGRLITIRKADSDTGFVLIAGTIEGNASTTSNRIQAQYGSTRVYSNGTAWFFDQAIIEDGSWTATYTISGGSGSVTTTAIESATYHRVGPIVHVRLYIKTTNTSSPSSGEVQITGFPYAVDTNGTGTLAVGQASTWGVNYPLCIRMSSASSAGVVVYRDAVDGATAFLGGGDFATGAGDKNLINASGMYRIQT